MAGRFVGESSLETQNELLHSPKAVHCHLLALLTKSTGKAREASFMLRTAKKGDNPDRAGWAGYPAPTKSSCHAQGIQHTVSPLP